MLRILTLTTISLLSVITHLSGQMSQEWERIFLYAGDERGSAVYYDDYGNVYSGGSRHNPTFTETTFWLAKYRPDGQQVWTRSYSYNDVSDEAISDIVCDADGNIYVAGYHWGGTSWQTSVVKYDSSGTELWDEIYPGRVNNVQARCHLAVDDSLNMLYLATSASTSSTSYRFMVAALNMVSGSNNWVSYYGVYSGELLKDLKVDDMHNVYVTGNASSSSSSPYDVIITVKYDTAGNEVWHDEYMPASSDYLDASALSVSEDGDVYVVGFVSLSGPNNKGLLIRYDTAGTLMWENHSTMSNAVYCTDVVADTSDFVYMTGWIDNAMEYSFVSCLDTAGNIIWQRIDSTQSGYANATQLIIGGDNLLYARGGEEVMCYSKLGDYLWTWHIAPARSMAEMCWGGPGVLYASGESYGSASGNDFLTLKISDTTTSVTQHDFAVQWSLYPNPANGNVTLNIGDTPGQYGWTILDAAGREVAGGNCDGKTEMQLPVLPAGMYMFRMINEEKNFVATKQLVIY